MPYDMLISVKDIKADFFKVYPEFSNNKPFLEVNETFKKGSAVLWFICHLTDYKSPYSYLTAEARMIKLSDYFFNNKDWFKNLSKKEKDVLQAAIDEYDILQQDSEYRFLKMFDDKLDEKSKLLESTVYDVDNAEVIDKIFLSVDKILQAKDKIYERILKSGNATGKRIGDRKPSFIERTIKR